MGSMHLCPEIGIFELENLNKALSINLAWRVMSGWKRKTGGIQSEKSIWIILEIDHSSHCSIYSPFWRRIERIGLSWCISLWTRLHLGGSYIPSGNNTQRWSWSRSKCQGKALPGKKVLLTCNEIGLLFDYACSRLKDLAHQTAKIEILGSQNVDQSGCWNYGQHII